MVTGGALGDPNLGHDPMALAGILDMPIYVKGGAHGGGWWSDLGSTLKKGVKEIQSSDTVRALEKQVASKGVAALRGVAEGALDDVAPEFAPLIDRGLSYAQKRVPHTWTTRLTSLVAAIAARTQCAAAVGHAMPCTRLQGAAACAKLESFTAA